MTDPNRLRELAEFAEFDAILHADNPARAPKLRAIARVLRAVVETPRIGLSIEGKDMIDRAALLKAVEGEG